MSDEIGQTLDGKYRLTRLLGTGPTSRVYLAVDTGLGRLVVVRILNDELAGDPAALKSFYERMQRESRTTDDFIVKVLSGRFPTTVTTGSEAPYFVYQYLSDGSLRAMLDLNGPLSPAQAITIGLGVAKGLRTAHDKGSIHYDIRPENILFDDARVPHIKDFGLARALAASSLTEPFGHGPDSVLYGAPEIKTGAELTTAYDVYSLGLVLAECVTGAVPLTGATTAETIRLRSEQDLRLPGEFGPLGAVLEAAGRVDPDKRPSAAELASELAAISRSFPEGQPLPTVPTLDLEAQTQELDRPVITTTARPAGRTRASAPLVRPVSDDSGRPEGPGSPSGVAPHGPASGAGFAEPASDPEADFATVVDSALQESLLEASRPRSFGPVAPFGRSTTNEEEDAPTDSAITRRRRSGALRVAPVVLVLLLAAGGGFAYWWTAIRIPQHTLPSVRGTELESAVKTLHKLRFVVDSRARERKDGTKPGEVIAQDPAPGTVLGEGDTVTLTVSLGPTLRTFPALAGRTRDEAVATLQAADLTLGNETPGYDETVPAGTVISAAVSPGSPAVDAEGKVPRDTAVDLVVSAGPAPRTVPSGLIGASVDQARAALAEVQLVANVIEAYDEKAPKGQIISSSAKSGEQLPRDSKVTLTMSIGPAPIAVPDVRGQTGSAAATVLENAGFVVEGIEGSPTGIVLQTDPTPGEKRQRGTSVRIFTKSR